MEGSSRHGAKAIETPGRKVEQTTMKKIRASSDATIRIKRKTMILLIVLLVPVVVLGAVLGVAFRAKKPTLVDVKKKNGTIEAVEAGTVPDISHSSASVQVTDADTSTVTNWYDTTNTEEHHKTHQINGNHTTAQNSTAELSSHFITTTNPGPSTRQSSGTDTFKEQHLTTAGFGVPQSTELTTVHAKITTVPVPGTFKGQNHTTANFGLSHTTELTLDPAEPNTTTLIESTMEESTTVGCTYGFHEIPGMLMNFDFVEHKLIYGLTFENCKQRCASDRQCGAGVYFITGMVCSMGLAGVQSTYTDVGVITIIKSSECNCEMEKHTGVTLYVYGSYPPGVNKWSFQASKPDDCPEACLTEPLCLLTQFNPTDKVTVGLQKTTIVKFCQICHSYNTWPFIGFGTAEEYFYVKSRGC